MAESFTAPGAKVLIVDDNRINLKVTECLLKPLQMVIDTAESGQKAIELVQSKTYDMIFMDHLMPGMDGVETTKRIRELPLDYVKTVPIVALTANGEEGLKEQLLEQGLNDFLTKPIDLQEICDIIRRWLVQNVSDHVNTQGAQESHNGVPVIEGLDVKQGIAQSGGLEIYKEILGDFYIMIPQKALKIEKCLADGLLRDYTIEVHALKTTARLIGAMELSSMCLRLEELGNAEAEEELMRDTPAMLELYRSYMDVLRPYGQRNEGDKKQTTNEHLISLLHNLHLAMDSFDLDGVDSCMKELEEYQLPSECQKYMEMLRVYVADVAMEDIMNTAKRMIDMLG